MSSPMQQNAAANKNATIDHRFPRHVFLHQPAWTEGQLEHVLTNRASLTPMRTAATRKASVLLSPAYRIEARGARHAAALVIASEVPELLVDVPYWRLYVS